MDLIITLGLVAFCVLGAIGAGWMGARPRDYSKPPPVVPWQFLMMALAVGTLVVGVHLLNLIGVGAK